MYIFFALNCFPFLVLVFNTLDVSSFSNFEKICRKAKYYKIFKSGKRFYLLIINLWEEDKEHFMKLKSIKLLNLRRKYNLPKDLKELLGPDSPKDEIIMFLKEAGVYEEIWQGRW